MRHPPPVQVVAALRRGEVRQPLALQLGGCVMPQDLYTAHTGRLQQETRYFFADQVRTSSRLSKSYGTASHAWYEGTSAEARPPQHGALALPPCRQYPFTWKKYRRGEAPSTSRQPWGVR